MKILSIKTLRGPNYWSNYRRNLIEMKLDLDFFEHFPTDQLPGFNRKLLEILPGLQLQLCIPGAFHEDFELKYAQMRTF